jgi:hypothetical protein
LAGSSRLFRTLDAVHLALIVHCVYYYLVINFANIDALVKIVWSFKVSPGFHATFIVVLIEFVQLQIVVNASHIFHKLCDLS